VKSTK
jgi:hypothetical protein